MSATALIPLTCYTHPNKLQSLLKYPNVICGSDTHGAMLAVGLCLLIIGVFGFLTLCTYAAYMVPTWSACDQHGRVRAFRFLVFRFRLETWPLFFCDDFGFFRQKFPTKGQCLGLGFLLICSSCP